MSDGVDPDLIDAILSELSAEKAIFLSERLEPRWKQRRRRLALRDDAIRTALELLGGAGNPAARLAAQMAMQERVTRPERLTGDHLLVAAVAEILRLNEGRALQERQLRSIAGGDRSPRQ